MRRRTWITTSIGLGALAGWAGLSRTLESSVSRTAPLMAEPVGLPAPGSLRPFTQTGRVFGADARITVLHADASVARKALAAAFDEMLEVQAQLSLYREDSALVRLNRDGVLDAPPPHLLTVLAEAQSLSRLSGGAFDATVQPLWTLNEKARAAGRQADPHATAAARAKVDWRELVVGPRRVRLNRPGMAVTLNGLAQGYGADVAARMLQGFGIEHALLDTGEFGALGAREDGSPWVLGVRHPRQPDVLAGRLQTDGRFVATSGDYETAFSDDFVRHHIFDPATGESPAELASVTVLAPTGMLSDGLSTALMVIGPAAALRLCQRLEGVDALMIGKDGRRWATAGLPMLG